MNNTDQNLPMQTGYARLPFNPGQAYKHTFPDRVFNDYTGGYYVPVCLLHKEDIEEYRYRQKYDIVTWPQSQSVTENDGANLLIPERKANIGNMEYAVPCEAARS